MNNLVEAHLDDRYSTLTTPHTWIDHHILGEQVVVEAFALDLN